MAMTDTIENLLKNKRYATLRDIFINTNEADIAAVFEDVKEEDTDCP